jgi:cytochrome P450
MPSAQRIAAYDLTGQRFKANPYPFFARLRADSPTSPTRLPNGRVAWVIARYDDVATVLKDQRFAKDRRRVAQQHRLPFQRLIGPLLTSLEFNMLDLDPPDHTRLRSLVHKAFTPRLIERLRTRIQTLADQLLDEAMRRERFDLVSAYALPIPATIIADLLGVPFQDHDRFHRWSSRLVTITSGRDFLLALPSALLFMRYLRRLVAQRRTAPRDDLITALVQAEEAGDHLSADELLSMVFLLLVAGHETTVNLIANATLALLEAPEHLERLRREPDLVHSPPVIEELLRFTSPVQVATERYALEDVELSGSSVPRGALVFALIGSANHDEQQFPNPDEMDLSRSPNPHLSFGQGVHYCLGAPLARLEGQIAIATLIRRVADLRLAVPPETLVWRRGIFLRGVEHLPVTVGFVHNS